MSHIDSEVVSLRLRLAALEQQKIFERENGLEKRSYPLNALEGVIDTYTNVRRGTSSFQQERYNYSREKLAFLEPILNVLKDMQGRLEVLEKKE